MSDIGTVDRAVRKRWTDSGLDAAFRAYWTNPLETRFAPFNDGQARPASADCMPYCVYESMAGPSPSYSTGKAAEPGIQIEYRIVPIQFSVLAARRTVNGRFMSGKEVCRALGNLIIAAYQDSAGHLDLDGADCHVETVVGQDVHMREDDDVWKWVFPFDIHLERRRALRTP